MNFLWMNYCTGTSLVIGIVVKMFVLLITYVIPLVIIFYGIYRCKKSKKTKETKKLVYNFIIAIILFAVGLAINKGLHSSINKTNIDNQKIKWQECYCELP